MKYEIVVTHRFCHPEFGRETDQEWRFNLSNYWLAVKKYEEMKEPSGYSSTCIRIIETPESAPEKEGGGSSIYDESTKAEEG